MAHTFADAEHTSPNGSGPDPTPPDATLQDVPLAEIDLLTQFGPGGAPQARERLDPDTIRDYAEAMAEGATFPPVVLFVDDGGYWIGDGFHRITAAQGVGFKTIQAEVHQGGRRAAQLYAASANQTHGLRRTNADKRRAVLILLRDEEWYQWSDRKIGRHCGVSPTFVGSVRDSLSTVDSEQSQRTYTTKHGTVAIMDTTHIGAREVTLAPSVGAPADGHLLPGVYVDLRPPQPEDDGLTPVDTWLKAVRELCTLVDSLAEQGGIAALAQRWSPAGQAELLAELEAMITPLLTLREELRAVCATIDIAGSEDPASRL